MALLAITATACAANDGAAGATAAETTPPPTSVPATTAAPTTTQSPTTTAAPTGDTNRCNAGERLDDSDYDGWGTCVALATTTTTPSWGEGVYLVPDEMPLGVYRVFGYWARLDIQQEIIDNEAVDTCPSILVLQQGDAYVKLGGPALPLDLNLGIDPIAEQCEDGVFLVGLDIQPGRYRIEPTNRAYWARLDGNLEIIDNDLSDGQLIVEIRPGDFAFKFTGSISRLD